MKGARLIFKKEWLGFLAGERSSFVVYGMLVLLWSSLIATNLASDAGMAGTFWWIFFSVIISSNFGNTVFIAERLSGSMEILLVSGVTRKAILFGKITFVICMTAMIGALCYALAHIWLLVQRNGPSPAGESFWLQASLYLAATVMNACSAAWLSLRLPNPRLAHFANLFGLALIIGVYAALQTFLAVSAWWLILILLACAGFFARAALKDLYSERVVQPVTL